MKNAVVAGQHGIFIPKEEFEKGLWFDEETKLHFQEVVKEHNQLIQDLMGDVQ